jgi:hypothetical protein
MYSNIENQRACWRRWYYNNKAKVVVSVTARRQHRRDVIARIKATAKCMRCPESDPACLDFHHRDGSAKDVAVSVALARGWSVKRILQEIEKCDILCANCHRKLHSKKTPGPF